MQDFKDLMNINDLVDYLPISYKKGTIRAMCSQKKIPFKKFGKALVFDKKEIDIWVNDQLKSHE